MLGKSPFLSLVSIFPIELAVALRDLCDVHTFVETGTYHGDTARAVAPYFERVVTIEGSIVRHDALKAMEWPGNVTLWSGPSEDWLHDMLISLAVPCLIFLDAHWIHAGRPVGEDIYQAGMSVCPLLTELQEINIQERHVILIDDVEFFAYPPRLRGDPAVWPSLDQIMGHLGERYVFVRDGMLCAVPERYRVPVRDWLVKYWQGMERYEKQRGLKKV